MPLVFAGLLSPRVAVIIPLKMLFPGKSLGGRALRKRDLLLCRIFSPGRQQILERTGESISDPRSKVISHHEYSQQYRHPERVGRILVSSPPDYCDAG